MVTFESEDALLAAIAQHDELVLQCVAGKLSFQQFCDQYNDFYAFFALDGHESDEEERGLLGKHEERIHPHRVIVLEILARVCSDQDARREIYIQAGRIGSAEAVARLSQVKLSGSRHA